MNNKINCYNTELTIRRKSRKKSGFEELCLKSTNNCYLTSNYSFAKYIYTTDNLEKNKKYNLESNVYLHFDRYHKKNSLFVGERK